MSLGKTSKLVVKLNKIPQVKAMQCNQRGNGVNTKSAEPLIFVSKTQGRAICDFHSHAIKVPWYSVNSSLVLSHDSGAVSC